MRKGAAFVLGMGAIAFSSPSMAGEGLFNRLFTTDTVPMHHWQLIQAIRHRNSRSFGRYSAFDGRTGAECGVNDNAQVGFYINTGLINARGAPDDRDPNGSTGFTRKRTFIQGIAIEFIYRCLSPIKNSVGLALYFQPQVKFASPQNGLKFRDNIDNEYRIIIHKNFLDDQLVFAYNLIAQIESSRLDGQVNRTSQFNWNNEMGFSYRFAPNWFAGLEARNQNSYGRFQSNKYSIYWLGPVIHYGGRKAWATLGALRQVYSVPHGTAEDGTFLGDGFYLLSQEKWEATLKVGIPF